MNKSIKAQIKHAHDEWIASQCNYLESCLLSNHTKTAYEVVKQLTTNKSHKSPTILDKNNKELTEEQDILARWTEYCAELYNHQIQGDNNILQYQTADTEDDILPVLQSEVEAAVHALKLGKSPGLDNIPSELIKAAGNNIIDVYTIICNHIWKTGDWPNEWTKSLIITIPKKGNIKLCNNHRTLSLINHSSNIMLIVILNRLKPQSETLLSEEQAGFRKG